jgi:hypothetical protein
VAGTGGWTRGLRSCRGWPHQKQHAQQPSNNLNSIPRRSSTSQLHSYFDGEEFFTDSVGINPRDHKFSLDLRMKTGREQLIQTEKALSFLT